MIVQKCSEFSALQGLYVDNTRQLTGPPGTWQSHKGSHKVGLHLTIFLPMLVRFDGVRSVSLRGTIPSHDGGKLWPPGPGTNEANHSQVKHFFIPLVSNT